MTVKELLETNMMLCDVEITLRDKDSWLLNQLNIGPAYGVKPPYPTQVPIAEKYAGNQSECYRKDAIYIRKNINAYDDGKDYFQLFLNRFPKGWLDLEVFSWHYGFAYDGNHQRQRPADGWQAIRIRAIRYDDTLVALEEPKALVQKSDQLEGQMDITEWLEGAE